MQQQTKPRLDRDTRREAILDVAQDVFLEEGFAAASMSTIAARLGGSKGTLYNYFKSKDELFEAFVQRRCIWQQEEMFAGPDADADVAEALRRVARGYLRHVLGDANLRNFRLIIAEAERSPELARMFYDAGPRRGLQRIAALLEHWAAKGALKIDDAPLAAGDFAMLCKDRWLLPRLCGVAPELTPDQVEAETARAVDTFLRMYGAGRA
jgi:AcrR family transcriptional regulator